MHPLETFFWGFLDSAAVEIMNLFGFYTTLRGRLPSRYRKVGFWVTRVVLALVAGAIAVAYEIDDRHVHGQGFETSAPGCRAADDDSRAHGPRAGEPG